MILTTTAEKTLAGFYELLPIGTPEVIRTEDLAKAIGVGQGAVNQMRTIMEYTHSMTHTQYKNPSKGIARTTYTLIDPPSEAIRKIEALPFESFGQLKVSVALGEPVKGTEPVYSSGPEEVELMEVSATTEAMPWPKAESVKELGALAPLRKSESRALVEATRQYLKKWDIADSHATALVEAGLADSKESIFYNLKLDHDHAMDVVAQVIPYIDELERSITNLERFVDALEVDLRRTKEQNSRLISSRTTVAINGSRD